MQLADEVPVLTAWTVGTYAEAQTQVTRLRTRGSMNLTQQVMRLALPTAHQRSLAAATLRSLRQRRAATPDREGGGVRQARGRQHDADRGRRDQGRSLHADRAAHRLHGRSSSRKGRPAAWTCAAARRARAKRICSIPVNNVQIVNAISLSGGSAYGLDAASGVMKWLDERNIGYPVGAPASCRSCRRRSCSISASAAIRRSGPAPTAATRRPRPRARRRSQEGNVGAGAGATVGKSGGASRAAVR